ncbi:MAG: TPM domain-containing protein [Cytophagia bacterium]|nr:TPM domain-containing protein [Cytophagia bacterium]NVK85698.1 TPM domain-containing protein [Cytophagia bacterium]
MAEESFSSEQKKRIKAAIEEAELNTSGEIRVHLENHCKSENVLDRAAQVFAQLKMHETEARNGVLIYMAVRDHKFAIIGDGGINAKVEEDFWDTTKEKMLARFKAGELTQGLVDGILCAGERLKQFFPYQKDDINELSDDISFGKN